MTIPCPTPQWPSGLLEVGPEQDPSILLRSVADIAGAAYEVLAIRIDPISMSADVRGAIKVSAYGGLDITRLLDELTAFTNISDRSLVRLQTGAYVMMLLPAANN
jgi:hypothetical protein